MHDITSFKNEKPTVILLHYFGGDKGSWQWVIEELTPKVERIALDIAGFGEKLSLNKITLQNIAQATYNNIRVLGKKNLTIVGHSMSGKIALLLGAIDIDHVIDNIILIAPSPPTFEKMDAESRIEMLDQFNKNRARTNVSEGFYNSVEEDRFNYAVASQFRVDPTTWKWWIEKGMKNNILDKVKNLKQDLHLIYSTEDKAIKLEDMESEVIDNLNFKSKHKLGKVRHLMTIEQPKKIADIIEKIVLK